MSPPPRSFGGFVFQHIERLEQHRMIGPSFSFTETTRGTAEIDTSCKCSPRCSYEPPIAPAFPRGHAAASVAEGTILAAAPVGCQSLVLAQSPARRVCRPTGSPPGTTGAPGSQPDFRTNARAGG